MSLVGNLEDLGLGEILQIIDLSAKSGVLWVRSAEGRGRMLFEEGKIRGALLEDEDPGDLPGFDDPERDAALQKRIQVVAFRILTWTQGDFRFEIGALDPRPDEAPWLLETGLNTQFLLLEGARWRDEDGRVEAGTDVRTEVELDSELDARLDAQFQPAAGLERSAEARPTPPAPPLPPARTQAATVPPPVIVAVDADLTTLEWIKEAVADHCSRVHIFQRSEEAVARIRQYVLRGELPLALFTDETPPDPLSGASNWAEIADRLRTQIPKLPVLLLTPDGITRQPFSANAQPDALAPRPDPTTLSDPRAEERRNRYAGSLQSALFALRSGDSLARRAHDDPWRGDWREIRERLRHATSRDEIWNELLDFVARGFSRTALFAVGADEATAAAQRVWDERGVIRARALTGPTIAIEDSAWLRKVAEARAPLHAAPSDPGDRALVHGLGGGEPAKAFVAPIERCAELSAVLYADQGGADRPLPDTRALELVLKEAGLALERLPGGASAN